ncbi:MAG: GNAT family N-acetyltransferase [Thermoplasmatota archaeon]
MAIELVESYDEQDISEIRDIFIEYRKDLGLDLSFQEFQDELEELPGEYSPPEGSILMAKDEDETVGCVALRKINEDTCEMKRLYVKPDYRGEGLGKKLALSIIEKAREKGYGKMKLDTLTTLKKANELYRSIGFEECEPYRYNPLDDALYMELEL